MCVCVCEFFMFKATVSTDGNYWIPWVVLSAVTLDVQ